CGITIGGDFDVPIDYSYIALPIKMFDIVSHAKREWGKPRQSLGERQSLMGETPKTALPPQDRAAFPRPRCIASKLRNLLLAYF
ncbi:MAG: hypothetical protein F6J98_30585, partial [Moorea sp. SIO4G2]|nr:hypothetical protein [Moorena sp. SIO4G2]